MIQAIVKGLVYLCYLILYYWFTVFLPLFIAVSFMFFFIFNGISIGLESGIIVLFTILSILIALYIINGKELFFNIIKKFKNMVFFPIEKKGDSNDNSNNSNNSNNNN
tara:strand:+ start:316 stop:639 length:324 start_codon:yes stop_codon:yes gene_type:complete